MLVLKHRHLSSAAQAFLEEEMARIGTEKELPLWWWGAKKKKGLCVILFAVQDIKPGLWALSYLPITVF